MRTNVPTIMAHAEQDSNNRQRGAQLAHREPAQRESEQRQGLHPIEDLLGVETQDRRPRFRPSSRKMTPSAMAAARGLVGDHHDRLAELVDRARRSASTSAPERESSCRSARRRTSRPARRRARAPRRPAAAGRRTAPRAGGVAVGGPDAPPPARATPRRRLARRAERETMFSSALSPGQVEALEHESDACRAAAARARHRRACWSRPSMWTVPRSGRRAPRAVHQGGLAGPDGPIMAMNLPGRSATTPHSALTAASPSP